MCDEDIFIAGRYNKYRRNLSQSPWIDKDDRRIKNSVQELIEDGLYKFLKFDKCVFSSSGREDVDVRMLGRGRPFVFRFVRLEVKEDLTELVQRIQNYVNTTHSEDIHVRDLQVVSKSDVSKNLKDGEEEKTKAYQAFCCCSRKLTDDELNELSSKTNLKINQKTPIRVLHRRSIAVRCRHIYSLKLTRIQPGGDLRGYPAADLEKLILIDLVTEAGTYIKEFVHGDFGRTIPNLSTLVNDCDFDLIELDVMEVNLDWPPPLKETPVEISSSCTNDVNNIEPCTEDLNEMYCRALKLMKLGESMPRGESRQDNYIMAKRLFEKTSNLVESAGLFSENETVEDIPTAHLKYLLIPAYLAKITLSAECGTERLKTFTTAESWIKAFFSRLIQYELVERNICNNSKPVTIQLPGGQAPDLKAAMQTRNEKIEKFKRFKLLESHIDELETRINSKQEDDDETLREYYLNLIKKWTYDTLDRLEGEVKPAIFFERNRSESTHSDKLAAKPVHLKKPFTIVKSDLQKQVFGIGYPSRPTVTVNEFIDSKLSSGELVFEAHKEVYANSLQRYAEQPNLRREQEEESDEEREAKEDRDDLVELQKKRNWDDYKDENPRGSGNRYNMG